MKKNQYIAPKLTIVNVGLKHGLLFTMSGGGFQLLEDGGTTDGTDITTADSKRYGYNVWDDDWSE